MEHKSQPDCLLDCNLVRAFVKRGNGEQPEGPVIHVSAFRHHLLGEALQLCQHGTHMDAHASEVHVRLEQPSQSVPSDADAQHGPGTRRSVGSWHAVRKLGNAGAD